MINNNSSEPRPDHEIEEAFNEHQELQQIVMENEPYMPDSNMDRELHDLDEMYIKLADEKGQRHELDAAEREKQRQEVAAKSGEIALANAQKQGPEPILYDPHTYQRVSQSEVAEQNQAALSGALDRQGH